MLGRIVGHHGLRGELKLYSYTAPPEQIFDYRTWRLKAADGREMELKRINGKTHGKTLTISLPGVLDRDAAAAAAWMDAEISVARAALPPLAEGEFYWADLEGLEVVTLEGASLGKVSHLISTGANDVMVVRDAERERLLPFVPGQWVQQVDLAAGRIVVDWDPAF